MIEQDSKVTIWQVRITTRINGFDHLRALVNGCPGESAESVRKRADEYYRRNSPEFRTRR